VTSGAIEPIGPQDSERDAAVVRIQDAFAQGRISHDAMEIRLHTALTARTGAELLLAVDSLPEPDQGRELTISAMNGRIRRSGAWTVPRRIRIESDYARVRLDFTDAVFESPVVDLDLELRFGRAKLILPPEVGIDLDGLRTDWKQPHVESDPAAADGPLLRVTGRMEYGRLRIRRR
jgi:hypothetical protein